jgi:hypothetical protein
MKRFLLASLGLIVVAGFGCLPDSGNTTGSGGTGQPGTAGNGQQGQAGNGVAGTTGQAGDTGNPGTAGDTGNPGTAGDNVTGTAGTAGPGTAGDSGTAGNGSGGNGPAGRGGNGTAGRGGNGAGGTAGGAAGSTAGRGGNSAGGTAGGGTAGRGGTTGTAGTGGSAAGTTGTAGATGNVVCDSVKSILDGFEYLLPCGQTQNYSPLVCQNPPPQGQSAGTEYLINGTRNLDKTVKVAGDATQSCTITLHIQGIVEPKAYNNKCTTYFGKPQEGYAFGPAAGGQTSSCYPNTTGNYNVYLMQACDGTGTTNCTAGTRYYWNGINQTEAHFSYKIDYTTPTITIKGGQTLWFLADDSNQSAIKNCDNTSQDGTTATSGHCNPITISGLAPAPGAAISQPYNGQFISIHVVSAQ